MNYLLNRNDLPPSFQALHDRYKDNEGDYELYVRKALEKEREARLLEKTLGYKSLDRVDVETDIKTMQDYDILMKRIANSGNPRQWSYLKKEALEVLEIKLHG